jgi:hypothetical protein
MRKLTAPQRAEMQFACDHVFTWDQSDGLDGMCEKCDLYVMKPECVSETYRWFVDRGIPWDGDDQ